MTDPGAYPLTYVFSYYTTDPATAVVVKNADLRTFASVYLSPGMYLVDFNNQCICLILSLCMFYRHVMYELLGNMCGVRN